MRVSSGRGAFGALIVGCLLAVGCSSDDGGTAASTAAPTNPATTAAATTPPPTTTSPTTTAAVTTTTPAPTTTAADRSRPLSPQELVTALAGDDLTGRDNDTAGSTAAQQVLIGQLEQFTQPALADSYLQPFESGTNVIGIIPGGDLADQWVIIGAHYDHLGSDCPTTDPADTICNGATDDAAGVAVAMAAARAVAEAGTPRRSVLVAFWDREEDGLLGSAAYIANPIVPLNQVVAYLNWDIQGLNLLPSLASTTVMVGSETGGQPLIDAAAAATKASSLNTIDLSLLFGQGRSDHANFVEAGVPSVFFTDANSACYHTSQDDISIVDFDKLDQQILTATALATDMASTDTPPVFDATAPGTNYDDASAMLNLVTNAVVDLPLLDPDAQASAQQYIVDLQAIVDAGPAAFDDVSIGTVLNGAVALVDALTKGTCDGYLG
jgi:hypothetical protein